MPSRSNSLTSSSTPAPTSFSAELEEPSPDASYNEVQAYLVQYSRDMCGFTSEEALAWARKLPVNGEGLYQVNESELIDLYGIPGRLLYLNLQNSVYSRVCSYFIYMIYQRLLMKIVEYQNV